MARPRALTRLDGTTHTQSSKLIHGKDGKLRYLSLHPSTAQVIDNYLQATGHTDNQGALFCPVCFRTVLGVENFCIICSSLDTLRKRGRGMLDVLQRALNGDTVRLAAQRLNSHEIPSGTQARRERASPLKESGAVPGQRRKI